MQCKSVVGLNYNLILNNVNGSINISFDNPTIKTYIKHWYNKRKALAKGRINDTEYAFWKACFSKNIENMVDVVDMFTFSERLKYLRKKHNLKQSDLSETLKINNRIYQYYEDNEKQPTLDILINIADYFNVSLDYLTGRHNH